SVLPLTSQQSVKTGDAGPVRDYDHVPSPRKAMGIPLAKQIRHGGSEAAVEMAKTGRKKAAGGQRQGEGDIPSMSQPGSYGAATVEGGGSTRAWGEDLRRWREEVQKWSRKEFCEQVEAMAYRTKEMRGTKLDEKMVWRWESGQVKRPRSFYLRILAEMGAPLPPPARSTIASPPESPETVVEGSACTEDDGDMDRRGFLRGTAAAIACSGTVAAIPAKVNPAHIHDLRASVDELYAKDQYVGGAALAGAALGQYRLVRQMLDEADYDELIARQLMSIAGELAVCVGWLSYDADDQVRSRELYSEAFLLADQAGDTGLAVRALEKMSLQSTQMASKRGYRGSSREAVRLSARAIELARYDASPRLHALLAGRQAIAHAAAGDRNGFDAAIIRAKREIDHTGFAEDEAVWLRFAAASEITVHEAKGRSYLGDLDTASKLYRASLEEAGLSPRNRVNYHAQLAATLAARGDAAEAISEGLAVLPALERQVASPRTVVELRPVRQVAQDRKDDEFCCRYDALSTTSCA
ncbi:MAG: twin-arginine translocation signal domain-containing protein, partial [Gammaproteobacteria bacterium]